MKVAVITPYHKEPIWKLERCHQSVRQQTDTCTHFLIADGHPRDEIRSWDCQHIILPVEHNDNGNTPRGIGSLCAMNEGYDAIFYLDADNWYQEDHVTSALYTHQATAADVVFSYRHVVFPDGEIMEADDPEDTSHSHVDTSCMVIFRSAYRALSKWCQMPQELGPRCDRVMFSQLVSEFNCVWSEYKSVYFETWYRNHFRMAGKEMPENARKGNPMNPDQFETLNQAYALRSYRPCFFEQVTEGSTSPFKW